MGLLRETREVAFGALALRRVLGWAPEAVRGPLGLPPGVPSAAIFHPEEARVALRYGGEGGGAAEVSLRAEPLGALLLAYCVRVRLLPVVRGAQRSLRVLPDAAALTVSRDLDDLPDPEAVPRAPPVAAPATGGVGGGTAVPATGTRTGGGGGPPAR